MKWLKLAFDVVELKKLLWGKKPARRFVCGRVVQFLRESGQDEDGNSGLLIWGNPAHESCHAWMLSQHRGNFDVSVN